MNGKELTRKLSKKCGITQKQAGVFLNAFTNVIEEELTQGGSVTLRGFGRFHTNEYTRKTVKTPMGKTVRLEPHSVPRFSASEKLKRVVAEAERWHNDNQSKV